jgi:hypothetical protein
MPVIRKGRASHAAVGEMRKPLFSAVPEPQHSDANCANHEQLFRRRDGGHTA